ncbi:MAG: DNA-directed RNA polymerase subunit A' [Candidatus Diapherotrites archaeon]|nr:DNA-directed RNA polymerase subunit A' [Candidatus Diapherotrites archaeon]MDZ4256299.1 DNA-directed RNA polymerase subunit A' [archaeon]
MIIKRIDNIEFGILSPEQIRRMSSIEIKSPETYDKDGYPMEGGLMDPHLGVINPSLRCKTCGQKMKQCPGHFGSLEMVRPVVHPKFSNKLEEILLATCQECGRITLKDESLVEYKLAIERVGKEEAVKMLVKKAKTKKKCPHCNAARPEVTLDKPTNYYIEKDRLYPSQIREWVEKVPEEDLALFGYDVTRIRPEWFILTTLQVPPITIRPSITLESGIKSEDDLTHKLVDVIRINLRLKDNIDAGAPQLIIEDLWDLLQYHVTTYFDNDTAGVPPAKHRSGRSLRTLVQRLKGKKGRFRYNLTGKRVNYAARSTIIPDPYLSINQVGVPEPIANTLTVPEYVTEWNIEEMKKLVKKSDKVVYVTKPNGLRKKISELNKKEVVDEMEVGSKIERTLQDGDIVLFNRQPSLHRLSMLAHEVKVMPNKAIRMNPIVCNPYNADFDGDEMNIHVPQTQEGVAEARELMYVQDQIVSPRHGHPEITGKEDDQSGLFILTMSQTEFTREEAMHYLYKMGITQLPDPDRGKKYSGKLIFSQILPKDLSITYPNHVARNLKSIGIPRQGNERMYEEALVKIENGKLISGIVDGTLRLIENMARNYPPEVLEQYYYKMSRITHELLTMKGISIGISEFEANEMITKAREDAIAEELLEGDALTQKFLDGTLEPIPGRTVPDSFELLMVRLGTSIRAKVQSKIAERKLHELFETTRPTLDSFPIIVSGARGSLLNVGYTSGIYGQISIRSGRPKKGFKGRLITTNKKGDIGPIAGGFVQSNFVLGMSPTEYFMHSMGGRQGEIDTGVATKVSGYLYRRLANSLKDLHVSNDETVRSASKDIVQFRYGEDGIFPGRTSSGSFVTIDEVWARLQQAKEKK